jgi:Domain of unknown function (DUF397)
MDRSWRKSSRCDSGTCVEAALIDDDVHLRDAQAEELLFSPEAWTQFVEGVKAGEFDNPS